MVMSPRWSFDEIIAKSKGWNEYDPFDEGKMLKVITNFIITNLQIDM